MPATKAKQPRAKRTAVKRAPVAPLSIADSLARAWESISDDEKTYALRTVNARRRSQHNDWQWPAPGTLVVAPDWAATNACGHGLHGLLHGDGRHNLISFDNDAIGQVVQVVRAEVVTITADGGGKVKFPRCVEVFTGTLREAVRALLKLDPEASGGLVPFAQVTGDRDNETTATPSGAGAASATGVSGAASATGVSGAASATGVSGAASATGVSGAASATGDRGAASATGVSGAASATGDRGAASATGVRGAASATGDRGVSLVRSGSRARVGENGVLILIDDSSWRPRAVVRYADEDGIKRHTWYKLVAGAVVESPDDDPAYAYVVRDVEQYVADQLADSVALTKATEPAE